MIGMHRKIFLPWSPKGMEKMAFKPGDGAKAFDTRLVVVLEGSGKELLANEQVKRAYLGL